MFNGDGRRPAHYVLQTLKSIMHQYQPESLPVSLPPGVKKKNFEFEFPPLKAGGATYIPL
jgi:hypothetical protein